MSQDLYKDKLSDEAFKVCRLAATERPFTGIYNDHWLAGSYLCACCETPLYLSTTKFNAGCGWPSFFAAITPNVAEVADLSLNMSRVEIKCAHCDSHLGHVFDDGPAPTHQRHCVNSLSLQFMADDSKP